jgi:hypothetical protein
MMPRVSLAIFGLIVLPVASWAQTNGPDQPKITIRKIAGKVPAKDAYIVKYYVDKATPQSGYETGSLHILYSDKTEVIEKLRPRQNSSENSIVFNAVGFAEPKLAQDKRTIAWTEQFETGDSYSIPEVLAVYRSGENIAEIQVGLMVWNWMFLDGGKHIAAAWGTVHFSDIGNYQLYDSETGRMIDEALGDAEVEGKNGTIHGLGPNAPEWARQLERQNK